MTGLIDFWGGPWFCLCLVGVTGGWGKQVSQYYFSELGLRHGSLYMNGKMLDLEGPTFNAFQVSEGVWHSLTVRVPKCVEFQLCTCFSILSLRIPYPLSPTFHLFIYFYCVELLALRFLAC